MKTPEKILLPILISLLSFSELSASLNTVSLNLSSNKADSVLIDIQDKIYNGFVSDLMSQETATMDEINSQLENLVSGNPLAIYWLAYSDYYRAIYHMKFSDMKNAETILDRGIERLQKKSERNSEDFALLSRMQGLSIQYLPSDAIKISGKMRKNAERALKLDPKNPRAHYVLASTDFYTPEQYGGGQICEEHLKKAIILSESQFKNPVMPKWGGEEAYEMLIKFFLKKKRKEEAAACFKEGMKSYPESYVISILAEKVMR